MNDYKEIRKRIFSFGLGFLLLAITSLSFLDPSKIATVLFLCIYIIVAIISLASGIVDLEFSNQSKENMYRPLYIALGMLPVVGLLIVIGFGIYKLTNWVGNHYIND